MRRYTIKDFPGNFQGLPEILHSSKPLSHSLNCAKMLHGRAKIICNNTGREINLSKNYSSLKRTRDGVSASQFVKEIFNSETNASDGAKIIDAMRTLSVGFFKNLEKELAQCLVHKHKKESLHAFLHLYRVIEKISIAFPLTYISSQSDFENAIEALRLYFKDGGGELSFASKFSHEIARSSANLTEYYVDFKSKIENVEEFETLGLEISRCCPGYIEDGLDVEIGQFQVRFERVPGFIVECRNRLFHFSNSGQKNFDIDRIFGASELCRMLVEGGLHWLSLSFDEVLRRQSDRIQFV